MKGQAAIEYLATYGWAILVLIMMVSALSYLGIINPRDWAPDKCEMGAEFHCKDHIFINTGTEVNLTLLVTNNLQERVTIKSFNCTFENSADYESGTLSISLGNDETKELTCITSEPEIIGMNGKIKADFSFVYRKKGGLFDHEISGVAFSQVST